MNWETVGAIGEIIGATGVIVTLAYLESLPADSPAPLRMPRSGVTPPAADD
jgi:hypothetical protein